MEFIGKGQNGSCYLENDLVLKIYKNEYIASSLEENIKQLSSIKSDYFMFPEKLIYNSNNNNKFIGYSMKYADGKTIRNLPLDNKIDTYINNIINIEYEIAKLSILKLRIIDVGTNNVLYTKDNEIIIIDTDFYYFDKKNKKLYSKNLNKISPSVLNPYFDIYNVLFKSSKLNYYLCLIKLGKMLPSNFLYEVKKEIEKYTSDNINSLDDFKNSFNLVINNKRKY